MKWTHNRAKISSHDTYMKEVSNKFTMKEFCCGLNIVLNICEQNHQECMLNCCGRESQDCSAISIQLCKNVQEGATCERESVPSKYTVAKSVLIFRPLELWEIGLVVCRLPRLWMRVQLKKWESQPLTRCGGAGVTAQSTKVGLGLTMTRDWRASERRFQKPKCSSVGVTLLKTEGGQEVAKKASSY